MVMINRRSLLLGATAVAASGSVPAFAQSADDRRGVPVPVKVLYDGPHSPDDFVLDHLNQYLYLIGDEEATRFVVGVGRQGMELSEADRFVFAKSPDGVWVDPAGKITLFNKAGPGNPLGIRAMFMREAKNPSVDVQPLTPTIHGTNQPELLAKKNRGVSHGCVRMADLDAAFVYQTVVAGNSFEGGATRVFTIRDNRMSKYLPSASRRSFLVPKNWNMG